MKLRFLKKLAKGLAAAAVVVVALLVSIVVTPNLLYANHTILGSFTVYHEHALPAGIEAHLTSATEILQNSEFYQPGRKLDLCLNDGSAYPRIFEVILGDAFGYGMGNKVVLAGEMSCGRNVLDIRGYTWNLDQLIAHEATHCLQVQGLGLFNANPLARHPFWKWEGYAEYVSRKGIERSLEWDVNRFDSTLKTDHKGWIRFDDSTGTILPYYKAWLMVRYCLDEKGMDYRTLLKDDASEEQIWVEMQKAR